MLRIFSLRLAPNFGKRPAVDKNFYLPLPIGKIRAFKVLPKSIYDHTAAVHYREDAKT